jgi:hypothetical protein
MQLRFELSISFYYSFIVSIYHIKHSQSDLDLGVVYKALLSKINTAFTIESACSSRLLIYSYRTFDRYLLLNDSENQPVVQVFDVALSVVNCRSN